MNVLAARRRDIRLETPPLTHDPIPASGRGGTLSTAGWELATLPAAPRTGAERLRGSFSANRASSLPGIIK